MSGPPVSSIRNLGPAYERACARAGINSAEELRALGADAAYARLLETGTKPHFIGYYALVMGLEGRPWNDCTGEEKKRYAPVSTTSRREATTATAIGGRRF